MAECTHDVNDYVNIIELMAVWYSFFFFFLIYYIIKKVNKNKPRECFSIRNVLLKSSSRNFWYEESDWVFAYLGENS